MAPYVEQGKEAVAAGPVDMFLGAMGEENGS